MTTSADRRGQEILKLAKGLLGRLWEGSNLDEAAVDAAFLFRFEATWCKRVSQIRTMMREMIGQTGEAPLSREDGIRWLLHLDRNVGLGVSLRLGDDEPGYIIEHPAGAYHILDETLREASHALADDIQELLEHPAQHKAKFERMRQQMWFEANQTCKIQAELERLARSFNLVPPTRRLGEYAPNRIKLQYDSVVNWVVWSHTVPSFLWDRIRLIENEVKDEGRHTIRPWEWDPHEPFSRERIPLRTRIRTWAIYYLSKRGGGILNLQSTVKLWNGEFPDQELEVQHYEDDHAKLFAWGTGKGLSPSLAESFESTRNRWAVIVGINHYSDSRYGQLHVCVKDVEAVNQLLGSGGFDRSNICLLTGSSGNPLTRVQVLEALKIIADATEPDDVLLFYFSGHGDEDSGESYLVTSDTRRSILSDSAVPITRVKEIIGKATARAKVIILDACHSGAKIDSKGPRSMSEAFIRRVFKEAEGIAILASCKQGEYSYEWRAKERSVFTHFLLDALHGQADRDGKGFVTVQDAHRHVVDGVKKWAVQNGCSQNPTLQLATVGDIPLVRCQTSK